ncbi:5-methyltetrahydropteroyltriglutamate--homocysteine methyltransferase [Nitrosomonas communis]|uniref:5-methyltetrahydropteroyltriglutamate--homocysteine methyltransferase n=1 Tax=Nitrosomonas communis TaxID=44574 RepID=A0A5D3Y8S9_9PROT|nr:5-methyltetrahydropteroyltriglutamate--homocysteine methyltransferase [Nitrosomonas communis]
MALTHNLGFPRMGARRELKQALEAYWRREIDVQQLKDQAKAIRKKIGCCKKKRV